MKLNEDGECMVEHHTKYKEIHGYDETVWMTQSEHQKLHQRLRREDKCHIPADKLNKIAKAAHGRTNKGRAHIAKYHNTDTAKAIHKRYHSMNIQSFALTETCAPNIQFFEQINYNQKTGSVYYSAAFRGNHGYTLPIIEVS